LRSLLLEIMAVEDTIRTALGIIGNVISFLMFLAPVTTFYKVIKWKNTRGFSGIPYAMTILNCALWVLYGLPIVKPDSILVSTINGIGLGIEIIYTLIFLIFCKDRKTRLKILGIIVVICLFFAAVTLCSLLLFHTHKKRYTTIGTICIIFNVIMYASPLSIMRKVIKEKSVKYMPLYLSIAMFSNGLIWTAYGAIHFDINLVLPNGLGAGLGACQLLLYAVYYKSTKWGDDDDQKAVQMDKTGAGMNENGYPRPLGTSQDGV